MTAVDDKRGGGACLGNENLGNIPLVISPGSSRKFLYREMAGGTNRLGEERGDGKAIGIGRAT